MKVVRILVLAATRHPGTSQADTYDSLGLMASTDALRDAGIEVSHAEVPRAGHFIWWHWERSSLETLAFPERSVYTGPALRHFVQDGPDGGG